ncbi:MAG: hypothetical protein H8D23_21120 [Candidatus Brocadiales bacterium]|nr:hypothetical protein [Candidatus Brocadiales bacterium]
MKTLKLFNAVVAKLSTDQPFVSSEGYVIMPNALWAKPEIEKFWKAEKLSGNDLNKTFHKSWEKVITASREELLIEQIVHYMSTYGTNMEGQIYIPDEVLEVPDVKVSFKVFKGYETEELIAKSLNMFKSGIALTTETIDDLLEILVSDLDYSFTGDEVIKNREAVIKIADTYGVIPKDTMEFFRYIIYRMTGDTLIIKNKASVAAIKASTFNPVPQMKSFGLEKLSEIFNRFKPLFLAMKPKHAKTINRISKLSKTNHKPLVSNPLNSVTSVLLEDGDLHWLDNATPFALFKAMTACYTRLSGQSAFVYRIRNGRSWTKENPSVNTGLAEKNFNTLVEYVKTRFNMDGKKFFFPEDIHFALPTSEKMFVGNFPTGTKFFGENMAAGIYWKNSWGAHDHDLSGMNIGGKVGWNSAYTQSGSLTYSGDITDAPNGAVEYLHARAGLSSPTLVLNNVYGGDDTAGYKIIVGRGSDVSRKYMMDPNNLLAEVKTASVQRQTVLGMLLPEGDQQAFVLLNFGSGNANVGGYSKMAQLSTQALFEQWRTPLSFNYLIGLLGGEDVEDPAEADYDFSLDSLEKDSFTKVFE